MLIFGLNLSVFCKEHHIAIKRIQTYSVKESTAVTLYDCRCINDILNVPEHYLNFYNAWVRIPGEATYYFKDKTREANIKNKKLKVLSGDKRNIEKARDIFSFILKQYGKEMDIYNMLWTLTRLNEMPLRHILDNYATKW